MTSSGIEPATFQFVAQHLNHCATAVPPPTHTHTHTYSSQFSDPDGAKEMKKLDDSEYRVVQKIFPHAVFDTRAPGLSAQAYIFSSISMHSGVTTPRAGHSGARIPAGTNILLY